MTGASERAYNLRYQIIRRRLGGTEKAAPTLIDERISLALEAFFNRKADAIATKYALNEASRNAIISIGDCIQNGPVTEWRYNIEHDTEESHPQTRFLATLETMIPTLHHFVEEDRTRMMQEDAMANTEEYKSVKYLFMKRNGRGVRFRVTYIKQEHFGRSPRITEIHLINRSPLRRWRLRH